MRPRLSTPGSCYDDAWQTLPRSQAAACEQLGRACDAFEAAERRRRRRLVRRRRADRDREPARRLPRHRRLACPLRSGRDRCGRVASTVGTKRQACCDLRADVARMCLPMLDPSVSLQSEQVVVERGTRSTRRCAPASRCRPTSASSTPSCCSITGASTTTPSAAATSPRSCRPASKRPTRARTGPACGPGASTRCTPSSATPRLPPRAERAPGRSPRRTPSPTSSTP